MPKDDLQHQHDDNDIIIKDRDGTYKILREGKFVPLEEAEAAELAAKHEHGPKRAPADKHKKPPRFEPEKKEQPIKPEPEPKEKRKEGALRQSMEGMADKDLNEQAQDIINKSGVTFASGEIRGRVAKALIAHLKGIRKPFETLEALSKAMDAGGAALHPAEAEKILAVAGGGEPEPLRPEVDISPTKKPEQLMPSPSAPVGGEVSRPKSPKAPARPAIMEKPPAPVSGAKAPEPSVADVKKPTRPMAGLATELAYSLADWRRLANNPQDRIKKIENQLGVLEQDGFPQMLKGLEAWRSSDVYRKYLKAGETSLENARPLSEILGQGGPEQLSFEEWQSVAELNERIRA